MTNLNFKGLIILLALVNVTAPIIFIWVVEITMDFNPDIILTNGFYTTDPIRTYHFAFYLVFVSTVLTSLLLLHNLNNILPHEQNK